MRTRERGESKIGCILYLLVAAYCAWLAIVLVPVYYNDLQLKNEMGQVASSYTQFRRNNNRIKEVILKKAIDLGLPLEKKDIRVRPIKNAVEISASYQVEVNFLFVKKKLNMHPEVSKPFYNVVH